ncbi:hypothetical protein BKA70DRAFT_1299412 [Coprinopsis sp. MPI-PUGE-AT-0042]|nr:hypothetical protein BKA70DRAFT_1299412 [Coprinopsis sp. MPI-PUGE-AT-0042]
METQYESCPPELRWNWRAKTPDIPSPGVSNQEWQARFFGNANLSNNDVSMALPAAGTSLPPPVTPIRQQTPKIPSNQPEDTSPPLHEPQASPITQHSSERQNTSSPGFEESQNSYSDRRAFRQPSPAVSLLVDQGPRTPTHTVPSQYWAESESSPGPGPISNRLRSRSTLRNRHPLRRSREHPQHPAPSQPNAFRRQVEQHLFSLELRIRSTRDILDSLERERAVVSRVLRTGRLPRPAYP